MVYDFEALKDGVVTISLYDRDGMSYEERSYSGVNIKEI